MYLPGFVELLRSWSGVYKAGHFDSTFFCLVANREFYMLPLLLKGSIRFQSSKCVLDLYLINSNFCWGTGKLSSLTLFFRRVNSWTQAIIEVASPSILMVSANNRGEKGPLNGCVCSSCFSNSPELHIKETRLLQAMFWVMIAGTISEKRLLLPANSRADSIKETQSLLL